MKRFYDLLAILAAVCTPIAPAVYYGWQAYTATLDKTGVYWLSAITGIAIATALEIVGYFAGHVAIAYFERGDRRWLVAAGILVAYVVLGAGELTGIQRTAFYIAPLVYLLLALYRALHEEEATAAAEAADNRQWQREQQEKAAAREHEERLRRLELDAQVRVERARAKAAKAESATDSQPKPTETAPLSGKALEIYQLLSAKPDATNTEIGETIGVSRQYVGQVRRELNGQVKHG